MHAEENRLLDVNAKGAQEAMASFHGKLRAGAHLASTPPPSHAPRNLGWYWRVVSAQGHPCCAGWSGARASCLDVFVHGLMPVIPRCFRVASTSLNSLPKTTRPSGRAGRSRPFVCELGAELLVGARVVRLGSHTLCVESPCLLPTRTQSREHV